jgi:type II secretory pathway pseudopilin PulG
MLCSKCGSTNAEGTWFCAKCGVALAVQQGAVAAAVPVRRPEGAVPAPPERTAPAHASSTDFDDEAWRAAIGPKNTDYYLPRFEARHASGAAARWHWPAFFVTFYWLLYRKLWGWALVYFIAPYVVFFMLGILAAAAGASGARVVGPLVLLATLGFFIVPPLVANQLYFARCKTLIERQRSVARSREHLLAQVEARGGTSHIVLIIVGVFVVIALIGMLAAIALPAYNDYTKRAKVAEALVIGRQVAAQVGEHYQRTGALPPGLEQLPSPPSPSRYISAMRLDPSSGVLEIGVVFGAAVGGKVYLVPAKQTDGRIEWSCKAAPAMRRNVPVSCRGD